MFVVHERSFIEAFPLQKDTIYNLSLEKKSLLCSTLKEVFPSRRSFENLL